MAFPAATLNNVARNILHYHRTCRNILELSNLVMPVISAPWSIRNLKRPLNEIYDPVTNPHKADARSLASFLIIDDTETTNYTCWIIYWHFSKH